jgi:hypothetical protein
MSTVEILVSMIEDLPNIGIRAVGNAALSVGFRALNQALRSPAISEGEEVALQLAQSAAAWYVVAERRLETLSPRERMYAAPQSMSGLIDFLLTQEQEVNTPSPELLKELGVSAEEYKAAAAAVREEQRSWLGEHRDEIESRWEALIASETGDENLGTATTEVAGKVLSRMDRIRAGRLRAFMKGWQDALGELALLKEYEKRLFDAWKQEGGRDDDLL